MEELTEKERDEMQLFFALSEAIRYIKKYSFKAFLEHFNRYIMEQL